MPSSSPCFNGCVEFIEMVVFDHLRTVTVLIMISTCRHHVTLVAGTSR